jgi:hypothetical protein
VLSNFVISGMLENNFSFGLGYCLLIILAMVNVLGKIGLGWSSGLQRLNITKVNDH